MSTVDFKPSDVSLLDSMPPLVDTMGRAEAEAAAALIVRTCQARGDAWQDVGPRAIGEVIRADLEAKREPFHSLNHNPFFRPDPSSLVKCGCAEWVGQPGGAVRFTAKGFEGLRRVVERGRHRSTGKGEA